MERSCFIPTFLFPGDFMNHVTFAGWPAIEEIVDGLSLRVAPAPGGRIISLDWRGTELLFTHPDQRGEILDLDSVENLAEFKKELGFRLWGGDKTWISPQSSWLSATPPIDLDGGKYTFEANQSGFHLRSPICRETGVQIDRSIRLEAGGKVSLSEKVTNHGEGIVSHAPWNVTQFLRPFDILIPADKESVRGYETEGDSVRLQKELVQSVTPGWSKIACDHPVHFKFGTIPDRGLLIAYRSGKHSGRGLAHIRKFDIDRSLPYAHGSAVEIYNSPGFEYLEVEVHPGSGPLSPGESRVLKQDWYFLDWDGKLDPEKILERAGV